MPRSARLSQGGLLGPLLFSIFINDIPSVENSNVAISVYAFDTDISQAASWELWELRPPP
jgi:hypothetical protein